MKEIRYFYVPDASGTEQLPEEEAQHCVRVLRLQPGDEMMLMDGCGCFYRAEITAASSKKCFYRILETLSQTKEWKGTLHLAMAPTKNMDRTEWFAEKATEIGFDRLTFLLSHNSERKVVKTERVDKILISAMKQSRKCFKPVLDEMTPFERFVSMDFPGGKYIAHCYDESDILAEGSTLEKTIDGGKPFLLDVLQQGQDAVVLIGPEGDFSIEEVRLALQHGFQSVSLGKSRLRTETAALVAVHLMRLKNSY